MSDNWKTIMNFRDEYDREIKAQWNPTTEEARYSVGNESWKMIPKKVSSAKAASTEVHLVL